MSQSPSEQRQDTRFSINHEFASIDEFISEYVTNISNNGVFIRSKAPLSIGTRVNLRFSIIMDDLEIIEGVGEVTRVSDGLDGAPPGMGVIFVRLTQASQKILESLLLKRDSD